jgi:hypothetical protein
MGHLALEACGVLWGTLETGTRRASGGSAGRWEEEKDDGKGKKRGNDGNRTEETGITSEEQTVERREDLRLGEVFW